MSDGPTGGSRPLAANACRNVCEWSRSRGRGPGGVAGPLFACRGCGSQWVPSEPWTPADRNGRIPREIRAVLRATRRDR